MSPCRWYYLFILNILFAVINQYLIRKELNHIFYAFDFWVCALTFKQRENAHISQKQHMQNNENTKVEPKQWSFKENIFWAAWSSSLRSFISFTAPFFINTQSDQWFYLCWLVLSSVFFNSSEYQHKYLLLSKKKEKKLRSPVHSSNRSSRA